LEIARVVAPHRTEAHDAGANRLERAHAASAPTAARNARTTCVN